MSVAPGDVPMQSYPAPMQSYPAPMQTHPGYAQPYYPAQQSQNTTSNNTVVVMQPGAQAPAQTTTIINAGGFGPHPVMMTCHYCHATVTTNTRCMCGSHVWLWFLILFLLGFVTAGVLFLCCLIPFCIPSCYNKEHSCPNCNRFLGEYSPHF